MGGPFFVSLEIIKKQNYLGLFQKLFRPVDSNIEDDLHQVDSTDLKKDSNFLFNSPFSSIFEMFGKK